MEDLSLPGLLPGDPQNRLSVSARRRVWRARLLCNQIQWEAHANADARRLSETKANYVRNQGDLKGARTVLKVLAEEFVAAGFSRKEFREAMKDEIEAVTNSFSLFGSQRMLLESQFLTPPEQKASVRPRPLPTTSPTPETESIGTQVERLRKECHYSPDELAVKIGIDVTTVRRHINDRTVPNDKTIWAYERFFSSLLKRPIVIRKMPEDARKRPRLI
jgi:DNA-binding XRE family transcriptional regulator